MDRPMTEQKANVSQEEITLRDLLLGFVEYVRMLLRKWWLIVPAGLLMAGYFYYEASQTRKTYVAELTFMLNEEQGGGGGGLASILGQAGIGGQGGGGYNLEKVKTLGQSQQIVQALLLDTAMVDGEWDRIANHIIEQYRYREVWDEAGLSSWSEIQFESDSIDEFDDSQRQVLKFLYVQVIGNRSDPGLIEYEIDPNIGLITLRCRTVNEDLTYAMSNRAYDILSSFYIDKTTAGPQRTLRLLRYKTDSIKQALDLVSYRIANIDDVSTGVYRSRDQVRANQLQRDQSILQLMYSESVTNRIQAEFALNTILPFFVTIDRPYRPLATRKPNLVQELVIGFLLGVTFISFLLVVRKVILDAVNDSK